MSSLRAGNLRQQDWRRGEIIEPQPVVLHICDTPPSGQALSGLKYNSRPKGFRLSGHCTPVTPLSHLALRYLLSNLADDHLLARVTRECRTVEVSNSGFNEKSIVVK